ncbi:MAG: hypothetical protein A2X36_15835 [Elusimicrobia bacterium GWA2_69_24]|nr:MAG: hypothetical protein A2X36_15835 [Elusimicrobia bacterium GWA2_69_24]HBL16931.1 hypothetical protein [Elusimicrobiota bacterium]
MIAKILIADDNAELRGFLKDYLVSKHHVVLEADDGAEAFTVAEAEMPHLIIMDVVMPGVYGSTAAKRLREYRETSQIPIIIMSGSIEQSVLGEVLTLPGIRYLKKPFDVGTLERTIRELLPDGGFTK